MLSLSRGGKQPYLGPRTALSAHWRLRSLPRPSREGLGSPSLPSLAPASQGEVVGLLPPKILIQPKTRRSNHIPNPRPLAAGLAVPEGGSQILSSSPIRPKTKAAPLGRRVWPLGSPAPLRLPSLQPCQDYLLLKFFRGGGSGGPTKIQSTTPEKFCVQPQSRNVTPIALFLVFSTQLDKDHYTFHKNSKRGKLI